jgi:septal ring factor EnvC (AmiA/AmiB activator)
MKNFTQKVVYFVVFTLTISSCVSSKKYSVLQKEKRKLDTSLDRANLEIKEMREFRFGTEEQLRAKTTEAARLAQDLTTLQKTNDELAKNYAQATESLKKYIKTEDPTTGHTQLLSKLRKENLDLQYVIGQMSSKSNQNTITKRRYSHKKKK